MKSVKTALSIPESTYVQAEETAKRLGMNRSSLYAAAVTEFLERHQDNSITERLNEVYISEHTGIDPIIIKMQLASLPQEEW